MPDDVVYWNWINPFLLGLVTEQSVFHWSIEGEAGPVKVFDRHATLAGSQIINYKVSQDEKWMVLIGISAQVHFAYLTWCSTLTNFPFFLEFHW